MHLREDSMILGRNHPDTYTASPKFAILKQEPFLCILFITARLLRYFLCTRFPAKKFSYSAALSSQTGHS